MNNNYSKQDYLLYKNNHDLNSINNIPNNIVKITNTDKFYNIYISISTVTNENTLTFINKFLSSILLNYSNSHTNTFYKRRFYLESISINEKNNSFLINIIYLKS